jgi:hypothetical protein
MRARLFMNGTWWIPAQAVAARRVPSGHAIAAPSKLDCMLMVAHPRALPCPRSYGHRVDVFHHTLNNRYTEADLK